MSEYEQVIDEIVKHGVTVKVNKIVDDNYIPYERKYVGCVVELDFSEHDKAFEDKIAELKKDYKTASELLGKYQRENESLKKRIIELENFSCQAEQETESLFEKLKQRIAGLEKELEEWKEEARVVKKQRDEQLKSFRKGIEPYVDLLHMHETIAELKQHIDELKSKNESLNQSINEITTSRSEWIDKAVEWQQKCEKLESKETEKSTKCTTVIVAKEINGQAYVTLDDFMSVVNDLQAKIGI